MAAPSRRARAAVFTAALVACAGAPPATFVFDARVLVRRQPDPARGDDWRERLLPAHARLLAADGDRRLYRPLTHRSPSRRLRACSGTPTAPRRYVVENVVLHSPAPRSSYALVWQLWRDGWAAARRGALFALHPVTTEAVTERRRARCRSAGDGGRARRCSCAGSARPPGRPTAVGCARRRLTALVRRRRAPAAGERARPRRRRSCSTTSRVSDARRARIRAEHVARRRRARRATWRALVGRPDGLPPADISRRSTTRSSEARFRRGRLTALGVLVRLPGCVVLASDVERRLLLPARSRSSRFRRARCARLDRAPPAPPCVAPSCACLRLAAVARRALFFLGARSRRVALAAHVEPAAVPDRQHHGRALPLPAARGLAGIAAFWSSAGRRAAGSVVVAVVRSRSAPHGGAERRLARRAVAVGGGRAAVPETRRGTRVMPARSSGRSGRAGVGRRGREGELAVGIGPTTCALVDLGVTTAWAARSRPIDHGSRWWYEQAVLVRARLPVDERCRSLRRADGARARRRDPGLGMASLRQSLARLREARAPGRSARHLRSHAPSGKRICALSRHRGAAERSAARTPPSRSPEACASTKATPTRSNGWSTSTGRRPRRRRS